MKSAVAPNIFATKDVSIGTGDWPDNWRCVPLRSVCEKTSIWNPARERRDRFHYIATAADW